MSSLPPPPTKSPSPSPPSPLPPPPAPRPKPSTSLLPPLPGLASLKACVVLALLFLLAKSHRDLLAAAAVGRSRSRSPAKLLLPISAAAAASTPLLLPPPLPPPLRRARVAHASAADPLRPAVLAAHVRVHHGPDALAELTLFLAGTALGRLRRNFSVAGCMLSSAAATGHGDEAVEGDGVRHFVVPATRSLEEAVHCLVPADRLGLAPRASDGSASLQRQRSATFVNVRITAVLRLNAALRRALREPVRLALGHVAPLATRDVSDVPQGADMSAAPRLRASHLMAVRSDVTVASALVERDVWVPAAASPGDDGAFQPRRPPGGHVWPSERLVRADVRYRTCLMTQINEPSVHLLPPWVEYHRRVGVDMVYLFDNQNASAPAARDIAAAFSHRRDVAIVPWPWQRSQIQAFSYFQLAARARCKWTIYSDVDEYVMVGLDDDDDGERESHKIEAGADSAGGSNGESDGSDADGRGEGKRSQGLGHVDDSKANLQVVKRYLDKLKSGVSHLTKWLNSFKTGANPIIARTGSRKARLPPLARYLAQKERLYRQVSFPYLTMVNSGHRYAPQSALPEAYVHRRRGERQMSGKTACSGDCVWSGSMIHACRYDGHSLAAERRALFSSSAATSAPTSSAIGDATTPPGCAYRHSIFVPRNLTRAAPRSADEDAAFLVHFKSRSWEDMMEKLTGPRASMFARQHTSSRTRRLDIRKPRRGYLQVAGRRGVVEFTQFRDMFRRVVRDRRWRPAQDVVVRVGIRETSRRIAIPWDHEKDAEMEAMLRRESKY